MKKKKKLADEKLQDFKAKEKLTIMAQTGVRRIVEVKADTQGMADIFRGYTRRY